MTGVVTRLWVIYGESLPYSDPIGKGHLWPQGTASFANLLSPKPYREQRSRFPSSL
jgi:hypothetical protein